MVHHLGQRAPHRRGDLGLHAGDQHVGPGVAQRDHDASDLVRRLADPQDDLGLPLPERPVGVHARVTQLAKGQPAELLDHVLAGHLPALQSFQKPLDLLAGHRAEG